ncbi:MAG: PAS domain-containing protein [Bdellovibrionales bacterium]|nr:PAS domain-containing protein [Bdellovibrionales bacterium]
MPNTPSESARTAFFSGPVPADKVIFADDLNARPSREPDYKSEATALRSISSTLGQSPQAALQELVEQVLRLSRAESAGISIAEVDGNEVVYRWHAAAGTLAPHLDTTLPHEHISSLGIPVSEALLAPFFQDGQSIGTVWAILHTSHNHFDLEDQRLLESIAGFTTGVVQAYRHARELEEREKTSRLTATQALLMTDTVPAMIAYLDREYRYQFVNAAYRKAFKLKNGDFIGKTVLEVRGLLAMDFSKPHLDRALAGHFCEFEQEMPYPSGNKIVYGSYTPDIDKVTGEVRGLIALVLDVSDKALDKLRLEKSLRTLNRERELRERFIATLSHDLRTPLTAARISAQLLSRKGFDPESVKRGADRIVNAIDRAERMIRDLLDSDRIKAGEGIPIKTETLRLDELVGRVVEDLNSLNSSRFQFENGAGAVSGNWDPDAIQRVIENLTSNAMKYGDPRTPITVGLRTAPNLVELSVHNQGNPIPEIEQQTLFNFYRRSGAVLTSNIKGWGIGLTLVKGITEAHSGTVDLTSSKSDGTTFYVRLPLSGSNSTMSS